MRVREADEAFDRLRPRLLRIAYRMLGSLAEAEDVVQDAWIRWSRASNLNRIENATVYLARTVTRLCLDHMRSARVRREAYIGSWLPEPLIELVGSTEPCEPDDMTVTLMMALERLSPLERAAFLLHDVFNMPFPEVAKAVGRQEAACRQLAARARAHIRSERPRFPLRAAEGESIARAFFDAAETGDVGQLRALLAEDAVAYADGGGKRTTQLRPVHGRERVLRLFAGLAAKRRAAPSWLQPATIDGLPGFIAVNGSGSVETTAIAVDECRVTAVYRVSNPDKLAHVQQMLAAHRIPLPH